MPVQLESSGGGVKSFSCYNDKLYKLCDSDYAQAIMKRNLVGNMHHSKANYKFSSKYNFFATLLNISSKKLFQCSVFLGSGPN